jgi:hypothetical protein
MMGVMLVVRGDWMVKEEKNRGVWRGSSELGPSFVAQFGTGAWTPLENGTTRSQALLQVRAWLFLLCAIANTFKERFPPILCFAHMRTLGYARYSGFLETETPPNN